MSLIDRIFFSLQDQAEISDWLNSPSKPGIGFDDDKIQDFLETVLHRFPLKEADIVGFDWSYDAWEMEDEAEMRIRLSEADEALANGIRNRFYILSWGVFATSMGKLIEQLSPGIMKSGAKITSSTNSRDRVRIGYHAGADWVLAMGDDALEDPKSCDEVYNRIGKRLKYSKVQEEKFTFCSIDWTDRGAAPSSYGKAFYNFLHVNPTQQTPEMAMQTCYVFRNHIVGLKIIEEAYRAGWGSVISLQQLHQNGQGQKQTETTTNQEREVTSGDGTANPQLRKEGTHHSEACSDFRSA